MRFKKKIIALILMVSVGMANISAFINDLSSGSFIPVTKAANNLTCGDLADPDKLKEFIITILEERIVPQGEKTDPVMGDNEGVINCVRKTACQLQTEKEGLFRNVCEQVTYTAPNGCKPEYVQGEDPKNPGQKKDFASTICQPVQVIYAQTGANILYTYISLIYRWTAGTAGIVTVLYLVIGGIGIATAQGDSGRLEKAKERVMNSVAGLVLLFLSALILYTINPNFFLR